MKNNLFSFLISIVILSSVFLTGLLIQSKYNLIKDFDYKTVFTYEGKEIKLSIPKLEDSSRVISMGELKWLVDLINSKYYLDSSVSKIELKEKIYKWVLSSIWDDYTTYLSKEEKQSLEDSLKGEFEWIWISIEYSLTGGALIIQEVLPSSPAQKSGLKKWDVILKANDYDCSKGEPDKCVWNIKWPKGTIVNLMIKRGEDILKDIKVTRDAISVESVKNEILEIDNKKVGYLQIWTFWEQTYKEFKNSLIKFKEEKVEGVILDLRFNWWGYLETSLNILSHFIEKDKKLATLKETNWVEDYYSYWFEPSFINSKIIVLINEFSASASEITAGTLWERNNVILVWKKSYWKGSAQEVYDDLKSINLDWEIKLTTAKWFTAWGKTIDKKWLIPDLEKDLNLLDLSKAIDTQLEFSKKVILEFLNKDKKEVIKKFNTDNLKE